MSSQFPLILGKRPKVCFSIGEVMGCKRQKACDSHGLSSWEVKDSVREGVPCQPGVIGTSWEASLPDEQRAEG